MAKAPAIDADAAVAALPIDLVRRQDRSVLEAVLNARVDRPLGRLLDEAAQENPRLDAAIDRVAQAANIIAPAEAKAARQDVIDVEEQEGPEGASRRNAEALRRDLGRPAPEAPLEPERVSEALRRGREEDEAKYAGLPALEEGEPEAFGARVKSGRRGAKEEDIEAFSGQRQGTLRRYQRQQEEGQAYRDLFNRTAREVRAQGTAAQARAAAAAAEALAARFYEAPRSAAEEHAEVRAREEAIARRVQETPIRQDFSGRGKGKTTRLRSRAVNMRGAGFSLGVQPRVKARASGRPKAKRRGGRKDVNAARDAELNAEHRRLYPELHIEHEAPRQSLLNRPGACSAAKPENCSAFQKALLKIGSFERKAKTALLDKLTPGLELGTKAGQIADVLEGKTSLGEAAQQGIAAAKQFKGYTGRGRVAKKYTMTRKPRGPSQWNLAVGHLMGRGLSLGEASAELRRRAVGPDGSARPRPRRQAQSRRAPRKTRR